MLTRRTYLPADREACLALFDSNVPAFFQTYERRSFERFLDSLPRPELPYFLLLDDEKLIAAGGVAVDDADARMCWGIVHAKHHGEKIGRFLLVDRMLEGAKLGAQTSSLETIPTTVGFFERHGFVVVGGEDNAYGPGLHRRDLEATLDSTLLARLNKQREETAKKIGISS